ncbi:bifunctional enoyl-CoA hydratase/phosphate acetyltransferase [Pseudothermotoga lettingae]|jgi:phosphate butyryltransferase|uniref:Phosphate butyryltransferase n=2 Tax=Pseudothermotoga TaxID=1643951 RepID=A8F834_PSELT|nr:bifunctional enoyl-CoA hydratase/phosphate acetyltransferase [Pseudothermotoga lettingae]ABV34318.1 Phosphate butyryltransferase [Pseudothermotoga lettingae TMO]GLI48737.1 phosphate acetyltransferase [Pseudothermotoga lettingae TMO]
MSRFLEIVEKVRGIRRKLVVASAADSVVLNAVKLAVEYEIVSPILVGPYEKIKVLSSNIDLDLSKCEVVDSPESDAAAKAVEIADKNGELLMKGLVKTGDLMKLVLQDEYRLKTGSTMTMVSVFDIPSYAKLLAVSDAGMIISPTLEQKVDMINAAVRVMKKFGVEKPKVAVLGAVEIPNLKMSATLDAAILSKMNDRNQIKDCIVDGPFALDNAVSIEAAKHKGVESPVAGDADVLIMPDIEAGNIFYKSMVFLANAKVASVILGARLPIVLTSRADSDETKLYSIALGALLV